MALASHQVLSLLVALCCASAMAYYDPREMDRMTAPDGEDDAPPYVLQRLGAKYRDQGASWEPAPDPQYYVLTEGGTQVDYNDEQQQDSKRVKRNNGPSLSIVNSLDVLRQRLLLEIARRRMRQSEDQILANREILKSIGKRDVSQSGRGGMTHASSVGNIRTSPQSRQVKQWTAKSRSNQQQL